MNNDNQSSSPDAGQAEEGKSPGRTLDMQNISINTMKEDIAKDTASEEKKGGWFDFMAKRKTVASGQSAGESENKDKNIAEEPNPVETGQIQANQEIPGTSLEKELEEFKAVEKPLAEPEQPDTKTTEDVNMLTRVDQVEAPPNLPVSNKPSFPPAGQTDAEATEEEPESKMVGKISGIREAAPLESVSDASAEEDEGLSIPDIQGKLKEALGGEVKTETVGKIKPINEGVEPVLRDKIGGGESGGQENKPLLNKEAVADSSDAENPFSSRIQSKEPEKSLLSSVEAALNYSAPPEFSRSRETQGKAPTEEGGPVVDLRKKAAMGPLAGIMANKKLLMIGGGVTGLFLVIGITLMFVLGGKSKTEAPKTPVTTVSTNNQNQNQNPVTPIKTVTQAPPTVPAKKVLGSALEIPFESEKDISDGLETYRQGKAVSKQSQLVFMKSDGSSATFQDLMDATGIMIPRNILTQPSAEAALIFVDFFHGDTVFGLIIPVKDNEELAMSKLKDWESTMVIDLGDLWKGINIDNKGAYFSDSQIFIGGRFALIDKKQGLSLDYLFQEGYILIAPGKDSMTILKNQFNPPAGSSSAGIKWEEESSTTVSGVNSNSNAAPVANENVNSQ